MIVADDHRTLLNREHHAFGVASLLHFVGGYRDIPRISAWRTEEKQIQSSAFELRIGRKDFFSKLTYYESLSIY